MNWVHASMFSYFPLRLSQINSLQYVSRSSTPCLDLWGIFSGDFLPVFACFFPCGFISCLDLLDFLWMSRRCWWSRHCVANSVGDGRSWKTENGNGPTRSRRPLTGLSDWEGFLQYSFWIIASSDRETAHNLDCGQSRNLYSEWNHTRKKSRWSF